MNMKLRNQDDEEVLDGDQTFEVYIDYGDNEVTDNVFIEDGTSKEHAETMLRDALNALECTCVSSGWRNKS